MKLLLQILLPFTLFLFSISYAEKSQLNENLEKIYDVLDQFAKSIDDLPPQVDKIAIYRIRCNRDHISAEMARFISNKVEEVITKKSDIKIVNIPQLKTLRVYIKNEKLKILNTIPDLSELWKIGKKYRIDAFFDGNCMVTENGNILLNLKLVKNKSGEILWSDSYINGPLQRRDLFLPIKAFGSVTVGFLPSNIYYFNAPDVTNSSLDTSNGDKQEALFTSIEVILYLSEATSLMNRILIDLNVGAGLLTTSTRQQADTVNSKVKPLFMARGGLELVGIILPKKNANYGYWLGVYAGINAMVIFQSAKPIIFPTVGIRSHLTKRFSLGGGIKSIFINNYLPFESSSLQNESRNSFAIEFGKVSYEVQIFFNF